MPSFLTEEEASYEDITNDDCNTVNNSFGQGEKIVYKVYYNWNFVWLSAGEVTFEVNETDHEYRISATGRTYSSYEWFFKVRDYYFTYLDKETLLPHTFIRDVQEGNYTLYDKVNFDQVAQQGTSKRGKTKEEAKLQTFEFDNCMHDMLSLIYKMRNLDYEHIGAGKSIPAKMFLDMETYELDIRMKGKVPKKWVKGLGYYNTFQISPELIAGEVFDEDAQMNIWVSDDENKIPLIIESPVSVGSVKVVLKEYSGLKHPFSSKVEK
ncbi:hypothetical protein GCM10007940_27500 [Portibacter lacus]|uniref:DUF3108 domain-containing protein n=2 Tax=Portibacter lacus TaxID=1099794 RepID=A0AA37WGT3_9BACT|nr:hypothetical protein GCM10007940_27500 [Portibacter lacus]